MLSLKHCLLARQSGNLLVLLCRQGSLLSEVVQTMFGDLYESAEKEKGCETGNRKQKLDFFFFFSNARGSWRLQNADQ